MENDLDSFGQYWEKIGQLFIPSSGHTVWCPLVPFDSGDAASNNVCKIDVLCIVVQTSFGGVTGKFERLTTLPSSLRPSDSRPSASLVIVNTLIIWKDNDGWATKKNSITINVRRWTSKTKQQNSLSLDERRGKERLRTSYEENDLIKRSWKSYCRFEINRYINSRYKQNKLVYN